MVQEVGFRDTTSGFVALYFAAALVDVGDVMYRYSKGTMGKDEKLKLLANSSFNNNTITLSYQ